jgi:predicted N-acetyltransferase YhbS
MTLKIRQETPDDYQSVFSLTEQAFREMKFSKQDEQFLVERLRTSEAFIPELSLVAELDGQVVGHILLTKMTIRSDDRGYPTLCVAPVSVLPAFQCQGIGGSLIKEAHRVAREMGYETVVLIGHPTYYPRFGYRVAGHYGISFPFEAPAECCMVAELVPGALEGVSGLVEHPKEFY